MSVDTFDCPKCGAECDREEVDVGVCNVYGPWLCPRCGWSQADEVARTFADPTDASHCGACGCEVQRVEVDKWQCNHCEAVLATKPGDGRKQ